MTDLASPGPRPSEAMPGSASERFEALVPDTRQAREAWYRAIHDQRCQASGNEFEQYVTAVLTRYHPDFINPDPMGSRGDGGCDGLAERGSILYASYGQRAKTRVDQKTETKLRADFNRALATWDSFTTWRFVTNSQFGPNPTAALVALRREHSPDSARPLTLEVWKAPDDLWSKAVSKLTLQQLDEIMPGAPRSQDVELADQVEQFEALEAGPSPVSLGGTTLDQPTSNYEIHFSLDSTDIVQLNAYIEDGLSGSPEDDYHAFAFKVDDLSPATRNTIIRWHAHRASELFSVTVDDARLSALESALGPLDQELAAGGSLDPRQTARYQNGMIWLWRLRQQKQIREHAVGAFLRDKSVQGLLWMTQPQNLLDFAERLLKAPIPAPCDASYIPFDVATNSKFPGERDYFIVYLPQGLVDAAIKKDPILQFKGFVFGWSVIQAAFEEIVIQYYLSYVGKKVVEHGRHDLETEDFLTGANSSIIAWEIGPH